MVDCNRCDGSLKFITYHFKKIFQKNNGLVLLEGLDNRIYKLLHQKLLNEPSRREREQQNNPTKTTNKKMIRVYFTFENGPMLQFQKELRRLWEKYYIYQGSSMNNVQLHIRPRTNKSLCQLLLKKKPPRNMLTNIISTVTTTTTTTTNITTN